VIKPSGGAGQRALAASQAAPKLQNEFGLKSGKTRRIFVGVNVSFASLLGTAHIEVSRALKFRDATIGATETRSRTWAAGATPASDRVDIYGIPSGTFGLSPRVPVF
jgi:hypothetical protein